MATRGRGTSVNEDGQHDGIEDADIGHDLLGAQAHDGNTKLAGYLLTGECQSCPPPRGEGEGTKCQVHT